MKFFKHFTDAHRGRSIQGLLDALGHMGLTYWILVEMCVEKLDEKFDTKNAGERLTESDCEFEFHQRILRQNLRVSPTNLRKILDICGIFGLLSHEFNENTVKIKMPNILKSLERTKKKDVRSTSNERPNDVLDKDIDKDKDVDWKYEAEICFQAVRKFTSDREAFEWLGPGRSKYVKELGGLKFIRDLKQNDFESKRLSTLIQNAWESLAAEKEGA